MLRFDLTMLLPIRACPASFLQASAARIQACVTILNQWYQYEGYLLSSVSDAVLSVNGEEMFSVGRRAGTRRTRKLPVSDDARSLLGEAGLCLCFSGFCAVFSKGRGGDIVPAVYVWFWDKERCDPTHSLQVFFLIRYGR